MRIIKFYNEWCNTNQPDYLIDEICGLSLYRDYRREFYGLKLDKLDAHINYPQIVKLLDIE